MAKGGKRPGAGRPNTGRTEELRVYVTPDSAAKLSAIAKAQKVAKGQIVENLLSEEINMGKRIWGEVNGYLFRIEEVLYVRPTNPGLTEYEMFFKGGWSLTISMESRRTKRNGKEDVYYFSLGDIQRELGWLDDKNE